MIRRNWALILAACVAGAWAQMTLPAAAPASNSTNAGVATGTAAPASAGRAASFKPRAATITTTPYRGVTYITRTEAVPRAITMHILTVDLTAPGISFAVTGHSGTRETVRQTTADFLQKTEAAAAINVAFFNPVSDAESDVYLAGLTVSQGRFVSNFDDQPCSAEFPDTVQSYAIVPYVPALNIAPKNRPSIVHRNPAFADDQHILENVTLWNTISGSAQIITDGKVTIPVYKDATHPDGLLTQGTSSYNNANSWYNGTNARTAIGFTQDGNTLVLLTVDKAGESLGMTVGEVADVLLNDYHCHQALNLDGGGSTAMALRDPKTGVVSMVNKSSDDKHPKGRPEGANLAVFALPAP